MFWKTLEGKAGIITGAGNGIGKETALLFAREGAKVCVADFDEKGGMETVRMILRMGVEAFFQKVDVTKPEEVEAMVKETIKRFGKIHFLVNNAGITEDKSFLKMEKEAHWDPVIAVNQTGVFLCMQAVAKVMVEQAKEEKAETCGAESLGEPDDRSIVNVSSVVSKFGNFGQMNYVATKAAINGMTMVGARELGKYGIRVNSVLPGFILTGMTGKMPPEVLGEMKKKSPLRKLGTPEVVANFYRYLVSKESWFMTGAILSLDGGITI